MKRKSFIGSKAPAAGPVGYVICRDTTTTGPGTSSTGKILWRVKLPLPATAIEFNPEGDTICCCMSGHGGHAGMNLWFHEPSIFVLFVVCFWIPPSVIRVDPTFFSSSFLFPSFPLSLFPLSLFPLSTFHFPSSLF